jgi:hypothetical protein
VRIAAVEARLATVVACPQLVNADSALAKPELALRLTAREDDVRELLDLLSHCRVGGLTHARSAVVGTAGYRNQDVLLRPIAFAENFAQLGEIDLELGGPVRERGSIISYCRIGTACQGGSDPTGTVKAVAMRIELKACKDTPDLGKMIRVFGANQKMKVNEAGFRRHIEPDLDVREDELNVRETPGNCMPKHLFVCVGDVIVCNSDGFDSGRESFKLGEVASPKDRCHRIGCSEQFRARECEAPSAAILILD